MARWPLRHADLLDNYRLQIITKTEAYLLVKCIRRSVQNGLVIILVLV